jgi:hypothetical protein
VPFCSRLGSRSLAQKSAVTSMAGFAEGGSAPPPVAASSGTNGGSDLGWASREPAGGGSYRPCLVIHSTLLWPTIGSMSTCSMARALVRRSWCSRAC